MENMTYVGAGVEAADDSDSFLNKNLWALLLIIISTVVVFGNVLVILSVVKERSLQNITNYFIVSLAVADLLVAGVVMPFYTYSLVNWGVWSLPVEMCDFYIAMDVVCSTSSIFNLVAISLDRYFAVTSPINYSQHRKKTSRAYMVIILCWGASIAIGSPVMLGLNQRELPAANVSETTNNMTMLDHHVNWTASVFNEKEALEAAGEADNGAPLICAFYNPDFIIYSALGSFYIPCVIMIILYFRIFKTLTDRANMKSGKSKGASNGPNIGQPAPSSAVSKSIVDNGVIMNPNGAAKNISTPTEESSFINGKPNTIVAQKSVETIISEGENGKDKKLCSKCSQVVVTAESSGKITAKLTNKVDKTVSTRDEEEIKTMEKSNRVIAKLRSKNLKKKKKRKDKSSHRKEKKATQTLAIVLVCFLVCWTPFFICTTLDALSMKFNLQTSPGDLAFFATTLLGYINSCVNPIIYTIFNPEFRKAFKRVLGMGH